jgi:hypothetical protein
MIGAGVSLAEWTRREAAAEAAWRSWRRPCPIYGARGVVVPSDEEASAVTRAEMFARSQAGPKIPRVAFWFVAADLIPGHRGATLAEPPRGEAVGIVIRAGMPREIIFLTATHELQHARDTAAGRSLTVAELEARALAADDTARRMRWLW